jgi:hypothetical protein
MPDSVANIILIRSIDTKNTTITSQENQIRDLNEKLHRLKEEKDHEINELNNELHRKDMRCNSLYEFYRKYMYMVEAEERKKQK